MDEKDITENESRLRQMSTFMNRMLMGVVEAMGLTVEYRDPYTAGHQKRVAKLCKLIAPFVGMDSKAIQPLVVAANLHDIGKIAVPAEVLFKPGKLTYMEYGIIQNHPGVGYDILKPIKFPWPIADMVFQHHERMDGSGYPLGLKASDIRLESRILTVADVVDSMLTSRPYRTARGIGDVINELTSLSGRLYDRDVVVACVKLMQEGKLDVIYELYQTADPAR